jgi:cytochrome c-type biogenesis protein CcmH/NrfG
MSQSAQEGNTKQAIGFTSVQAYTLAVITLVIGIAVGYFARGSAPTPSAPEVAQAPAAAPAGTGGGQPMSAGQLPGIGSQPAAAGGASPEMLAEAAKPLLARLQTNPKDVEALKQLGNIYYDGQAYPQAIEYYSKALEVTPNNPDVITDLGTAYWYTGNADKAIEEYQKSLAIRPNYPNTLLNLGVVKWQGKKDPQGAVVVWEQLLKTNPNYEQKEQVQMLIERAKMHGAGATKG